MVKRAHVKQDAWQSDGQGDQTHSGSYVASNGCHNQLAGYYIANSTTPGTQQQDAWHSDFSGTGPFTTSAYPEQASHLVIGNEQPAAPAAPAAFGNFNYQPTYQQEVWHHAQGAPEPNVFFAGPNVTQTGGFPNPDHTYLVQSRIPSLICAHRRDATS